MQYNNQIAIGCEFFKNATRDYSNHFWAWAREIVQNSIDAPGCTEIQIDITNHPETKGTLVTVENDGEPMTEEILVGKLLALGGSGKGDGAGTVGGFGKAKEILYFCHEHYTIHTGDLVVTGSGACYNLATGVAHLSGTRSDVVWMANRDVTTRLREQFERLIHRTRWEGTFVLGGVAICPEMGMNRARKVFDWGKVYVTDLVRKECVVRMKGMPMFCKEIEADKGVIVELTGKSTDCLTSNRDGLQWSQSNGLDSFITRLSVDTRSALLADEPTYQLIESGYKLGYTRDIVRKMVGLSIEECTAIVNDACKDNGALMSVLAASIASHADMGHPALPHTAIPGVPKAHLAFDFLLKNVTSRKIPSLYDPSSERFSTDSRRLVKWWSACLLALHQVWDHEAEFTVGFVFNAECEAEYEDRYPHGKAYFINPCHVAEGPWKARYGKADSKHAVLALAIHEFVHGLGESYHNETYAGLLTDVTKKVFANMARFNKCFR